MHRSRLKAVTALLGVLALVGAACSKSSSSPGGETGTPAPTDQTVCASADLTAGDLLAKICESGLIRFATDPVYPPQSSLNPQTGEYEGFDIDTATEIAKRMGLEIEWATPDWTVLTAGGWNDRWDVSVGSMTITPERAEVLYFTQPYYFAPAGFAVHADNTTITSAADLAGQKVGVCGGCTYEDYLNGTLQIPDYTIDFAVAGAELVTYKTDKPAIDDLALGDCVRLCAAFSAVPTLQGAIDAGKAIKIVGPPLFYEPLAVAIDRSAPLDAASFVAALDEIVAQMHADGTLTAFSMATYGEDLTIQQGA